MNKQANLLQTTKLIFAFCPDSNPLKLHLLYLCGISWPTLVNFASGLQVALAVRAQTAPANYYVPYKYSRSFVRLCRGSFRISCRYERLRMGSYWVVLHKRDRTLQGLCGEFTEFCKALWRLHCDLRRHMETIVDVARWRSL